MRVIVTLTAALLLWAAPLAAQQAQSPVVATSATPAPENATERVARGSVDGQSAAGAAGTGGYFAGGFVSGVFLGLIGTGITYAVAGSSAVELPADRRVAIAGESSTYQQAYEKAYADKVKSKRKGSALGGGLLGTATFVLLLLSASGGE